MTIGTDPRDVLGVMNSRGALLLLLLTSCNTDLVVPSAAQIKCTHDDECPADYTCATGVGRCVPDTPDSDGPQLLSVSAGSETVIRLTFDERLAEEGATKASNYSVTPGLSISQASLDDSAQTVELVVSPQEPGVTYTVELAGLSDWRGNLMQPASMTFIGFGTPPDTTPPEPLAPAQDAVVNYLSVLLAWSVRTGADEYRVDVARDADFTELVAGSPFTTPGTTLTLSSLGGPYTYFWRVRANTTVGEVPVMRFDGIDFVTRVYCAPTDDCAASAEILEAGNYSRPFRSIARALAAAVQTGATTVHVASRGGDTAYHEAIEIPNAVQLSGAHASDFSGPVQDATANPTIVVNETNPVVTIGLTPTQTTLRDFVVRTEGAFPALHVIGGGTALSVEDNVFGAGELATVEAVVLFESAKSPSFSNNRVVSTPCPVALKLSSSIAHVTNNHIEAGGDVFEHSAVLVNFGGNVSLTDNVILVSGGQVARAVNIIDSGNALLEHNVLVASGAAGAVQGITASYGSQGRLLRNRVFAFATGLSEASALATWETGSLIVASNVLVSIGESHALVAQLSFSDNFVQMLGNTMLVAEGGTVVHQNFSHAVFANNIMTALGNGTGSIGMREGEEGRPNGLLNNLIFNVETPYMVNTTPTTVASLDDPSGGQGTYARVTDNIVPDLGDLALDAVFVDGDGADNNVMTYEDNDYDLKLTSDLFALATSGLNIVDGPSPNCYGYNLGDLACYAYGNDLEGTERLAPLSLGAYEKN